MDNKKMDLESLDELISLCEDKMVKPFRKKQDDEPGEPEAVEEPEEKPDMSEMDMDDLIEAYESAKGNK
jgi:hypothetical protein